MEDDGRSHGVFLKNSNAMGEEALFDHRSECRDCMYLVFQRPFYNQPQR